MLFGGAVVLVRVGGQEQRDEGCGKYSTDVWSAVSGVGYGSWHSRALSMGIMCNIWHAMCYAGDAAAGVFV